ncbi:MAG: adenylate/guanylate cyclase domain-containing protein [Pseudomonadota bacterium]
MIRSTHSPRFDVELARQLTINERNLARVALGVAGVGALAGAYMLTVHLRLGLALVGLAVAFGVYTGAVVPRLLRRRDWLHQVQPVNVTLEVSVPLVVSLIDLHFLGGRYAFTSTPVLLVFVAVIASGVRWRPALAVYAGVLGAAQQGVLYVLCRPDIRPEHVLDLPSLSWGHAVQRIVMLCAAGVLAGVVAHLGRGIAVRTSAALVEEERLRHLFGEYVSEQALEQVLSGSLALAGERRTVTVLFADIRGFTTLSAAVPPEVVVDYLNRYFDRVCAVVASNRGMVNKFMGDGLLAVFGAPEEDPDHARHALQAAWGLVEAARQVPRPGGEATRVGVGLHTGELVLGSVGSKHHRDYTVVGDTVNLASRIEGLTRELGQDILLSESTRRAAGDLDSQQLGSFEVKGLSQPVVVHTLRSLP